MSSRGHPKDLDRPTLRRPRPRAERGQPGSRSRTAARSSTSLEQQTAPQNHADEIGLARRASSSCSSSFGTVVAAFLPLDRRPDSASTIATADPHLLATEVTIGTVAPILGSMIGLGVGIDYSLLIVSRFRQNRDDGLEVHDRDRRRASAPPAPPSLFAGVRRASRCAGSALAGIPYVSTLGVLGRRCSSRSWCSPRSRCCPRCSASSGRGSRAKHTNVEARRREVGGCWYRSRTRSAGAWCFVVASLIVLLVLAAPALDMQLGFTDDGDAPDGVDPAQGVRPDRERLRSPARTARCSSRSALPDADAPTNEAPIVADVEKLARRDRRRPASPSVTAAAPEPGAQRRGGARARRTGAERRVHPARSCATLRDDVIPAATAGHAARRARVTSVA